MKRSTHSHTGNMRVLRLQKNRPHKENVLRRHWRPQIVLTGGLNNKESLCVHLCVGERERVCECGVWLTRWCAGPRGPTPLPCAGPIRTAPLGPEHSLRRTLPRRQSALGRRSQVLDNDGRSRPAGDAAAADPTPAAAPGLWWVSQIHVAGTLAMPTRNTDRFKF